MSRSTSQAKSLAQQLLDAQVAYHLERLTGDQLEATVAGLAENLLAVGGLHQVEDLVDREAVTAIVVRALATVPASAAVRSGHVTMPAEGPQL